MKYYLIKLMLDLIKAVAIATVAHRGQYRTHTKVSQADRYNLKKI